MIALDNSPARGDYVRYIEDLMARAALAAPTVVASDGDLAGGVAELMRERSNATSRAVPTRRDDAADDRTATLADVVRQARTSATTSSGFATPTAPSPGATAASALASASMSGQVGRRSALPSRKTLRLAALVVGALLFVVGLLHGVDRAFLIAGGALAAWAFRRPRLNSSRTVPRRSA